MVFSRVSFIEAPVPELAELEMPVTAALLQVYVGVGVVLLTIVKVLETVLHQLAETGLVITEVGFTVTVTV